MKRREFITALGSAAVAWPIGAPAQERSIPVVGFLSSASPGAYAEELLGFRKGLDERGYVEGHNVVVEYRWANDQSNRLPALASDLVQRRVSVITVVGSPAARAAKASTSIIPIVFYVGVDPIHFGLVASLSRPGGNLTGVTNLSLEAHPKRLELLRELIPTATDIAALINPTRSNAEVEAKELHAAARPLGLKLHILYASSERDFEAVFAKLVQLRVGGLFIAGDPFFNNHSQQLGLLSLRHAVPATYQFRRFAAAGGLLSYGSDIVDMFRVVGTYTGRILAGEHAAELPVQQSAKVELIINTPFASAIAGCDRRGVPSRFGGDHTFGRGTRERLRLLCAPLGPGRWRSACVQVDKVIEQQDDVCIAPVIRADPIPAPPGDC